MSNICVAIKDLPEVIKEALVFLKYFKKDIYVNITNEVALNYPSGQGKRSFAMIINLQANEKVFLQGSWGGSNMFEPQNRIDNDDRIQALGKDIVVILGSQGMTTYCDLYIGSVNIVPTLTIGETLSDKEKQILAIYRGIKSSVRSEYLQRNNVNENEIKKLIDSGYLKKDGRGITITTKGKNASIGTSAW